MRKNDYEMVKAFATGLVMFVLLPSLIFGSVASGKKVIDNAKAALEYQADVLYEGLKDHMEVE